MWNSDGEVFTIADASIATRTSVSSLIPSGFVAEAGDIAATCETRR